jgi:large subunit ribosomal protein L3
MNTYFGYKHKMTQAWDKQGRRLSVTVVSVEPLVVSQVKSLDNDGYSAAQVVVGQKNKKAKKPLAKHLVASGITMAPKKIKEFTLAADEALAVGDAVTIDAVLKVGDVVKVAGTTKGKGFAGVVKRWGFAGGPRTHGQSDRERAPGSIGQGTTPGRVYKGKKMAGHMGTAIKTIRNMQVLAIDVANHLIFLDGPIPGHAGSLVTITKMRDGQKEIEMHPNSPLVEKTLEPETNQEAEASQTELTQEETQKE